MNNNNQIISGMVSRYVKPSAVEHNKVLNSAFDLRDSTPPEEYVSFFLLSKDNVDEMYMEAKKIIKIIKKPNGAVTILDVAKALADINDEGQDIIRFVKKGLPHCGLVYLSKSLTKIQEAKTTLSFLASERFRLVKCIA